MIGLLVGVVDSIEGSMVVLNVGGVGYLVHMSGRDIDRLHVGDKCRCEIEMRVREDSMTLYGFLDRANKDCFVLLNKVSGVSGRLALALLSASDANDIYAAIASKRSILLNRASGVGPKLAQRIVDELQDKVPMHNLPDEVGISSVRESSDAEDAVEALMGLGYKRSDAMSTVRRIVQESEGESISLEDMVKKGINALHGMA